MSMNMMKIDSSELYQKVYGDVSDFCMKNEFPLYKVALGRAYKMNVNVNAVKQFVLDYPNAVCIRLDNSFKFSSKNDKLIGKTKKVFDTILNKDSVYFVGDFSDKFCENLGINVSSTFEQYVSEVEALQKTVNDSKKKEKTDLLNKPLFRDSEVHNDVTTLERIIASAEENGQTPLYQLASRNNLIDYNGNEDRMSAACTYVSKFEKLIGIVEECKDLIKTFDSRYRVIYVAPSVWKAYKDKMPKFRHVYEEMQEYAKSNIDKILRKFGIRKYASISDWGQYHIDRGMKFIENYEKLLGGNDAFEHFKKSMESSRGLSLEQTRICKEVLTMINKMPADYANDACDDGKEIDKINEHYAGILRYSNMLDAIKFDSSKIQSYVRFLTFVEKANKAGITL